MSQIDIGENKPKAGHNKKNNKNRKRVRLEGGGGGGDGVKRKHENIA